MHRTFIAAIVVALFAATSVSAQELSAEDLAINNTVTLGETAEAPSAWLGETPHFVMVGTYGDYSFNINVPDLETGEIELGGKREYRPGENGLDYIDFEIALDAVIGGIERSLEMEFENADFSTFTLPADFALQSDEEFPSGERSTLELEFEWEWVEKSVVVNEEFLYGEGALTLALEEGTPDADGVADNGLIGGFVEASVDGQVMAISFTAPVVEAEIDD